MVIARGNADKIIIFNKISIATLDIYMHKNGLLWSLIGTKAAFEMVYLYKDISEKRPYG